MVDALKPEWWFYHLRHTPLERAAAPLVEKCFKRGWRVLVVSPEATRRASLDTALWTYSDESFLPHGCCDNADIKASVQPVLIADTAQNTNESQAVLLIDGADLAADAPFKRCLVMFDDGDASARQKAQEQFRQAKAAGLIIRYFQQSGQGWREAAST